MWFILVGKISLVHLDCREFWYSTLRHPQGNGQAEATNKTILNTLKKQLKEANGKWVDELPRVHGLIGPPSESLQISTPFALVY